MADAQIKERIRDALKSIYFDSDNDFVDVSDGELEDSIHLVIVSRKFEGSGMMEKIDLIWSVLLQKLSPEDWGLVSLTIGITPEEIRKAC